MRFLIVFLFSFLLSLSSFLCAPVVQLGCGPAAGFNSYFNAKSPSPDQDGDVVTSFGTPSSFYAFSSGTGTATINFPSHLNVKVAVFTSTELNGDAARVYLQQPAAGYGNSFIGTTASTSNSITFRLITDNKIKMSTGGGGGGESGASVAGAASPLFASSLAAVGCMISHNSGIQCASLAAFTYLSSMLVNIDAALFDPSITLSNADCAGDTTYHMIVLVAPSNTFSSLNVMKGSNTQSWCDFRDNFASEDYTNAACDWAKQVKVLPGPSVGTISLGDAANSYYTSLYTSKYMSGDLTNVKGLVRFDSQAASINKFEIALSKNASTLVGDVLGWTQWTSASPATTKGSYIEASFSESITAATITSPAAVDVSVRITDANSKTSVGHSSKQLYIDNRPPVCTTANCVTASALSTTLTVRWADWHPDTDGVIPINGYSYSVSTDSGCANGNVRAWTPLQSYESSTFSQLSSITSATTVYVGFKAKNYADVSSALRCIPVAINP